MTRSAPTLVLGLALLGLVAASSPARAEDFSFQVEGFQKQLLEWGGYFEANGSLSYKDEDAPSPSPPADDDDLLVPQAAGAVNLEGKLRTGPATLHAHLRAQASSGELGYSHQIKAYRLSVATQPSPLLNLEVGQTLLRWGKGYAFNPVAFVDRPKDPGDPEEALLGFVMATAEFTRSFDGPLTTLSLSGVVLPVHPAINEDFGAPGHENFAARLYLLLWDMDLDLLMLLGDSRGNRFGLDLAYNLTPALEVHGEVALLPEAQVPHLAEGQPPAMNEEIALQALLGLRYLTERETTYIAEYFYNGAGVDPAQLSRFHDQLASGPGVAPSEAAAAVLEAFRSPFPMRHYLYLRVSQKEPFGWLEVYPALTGIVNLEDGSFTAAPELAYRGITNLELRLRASAIVGPADSDFGERPNDARFDLRIRHFF